MKVPRLSLTIGEIFVLSMSALVLLLASLLYVMLQGSRQSILHSSDRLREVVSVHIATAVEAYLQCAETAVEAFENELKFNCVNQTDLKSLEARLFAQLLQHPELTEFTLTYGRRTGFDTDGQSELAKEARGQLALYRLPGEQGNVILTRHTYLENGRFVCDIRHRPPKGSLWSGSVEREKTNPEDPTEHLTFKTPAQQSFRGRPLWSDLHWAQLDENLAEKDRRVEVSVQQAVEDADGNFVGVIRAGLEAANIDKISRLRMADDDEHRIFLCDNKGRLVTHLSPGDPLKLINEKGEPDPDGDLRVVPPQMSPEIASAVALPGLARVGVDQDLTASARMDVARTDFLVSFRALKNGQDWIVGIVAPEAYYLGDLVAIQNRLLAACLTIMACILMGGFVVVRMIRRGLQQVVSETDRMRLFDFGASPSRTSLRDIRAALDSLEVAKTALRAMGKYVPIALVRQLYQARKEPVLGSELRVVTLMFTDIEAFTTVSEELSANELAVALGQYLQVMTDAIQRTEGTVDKYVGDAIMTIWNAPQATDHHARRACQAALDCMKATAELYASPAWEGRPAWVTRFGLHRDEVAVGHFGAPNRISYTAIGDGVNLASRLEGLNKQYGTCILVSSEIYAHAKEYFEFRRLDRVAVKGKRHGVDVYELLGVRGKSRDLEICRAYEDALQAYFAREFHRAMDLLRSLVAVDKPSSVLYRRCEVMSQQDVPVDWDGVFVSREK